VLTTHRMRRLPPCATDSLPRQQKLLLRGIESWKILTMCNVRRPAETSTAWVGACKATQNQLPSAFSCMISESDRTEWTHRSPTDPFHVRSAGIGTASEGACKAAQKCLPSAFPYDFWADRTQCIPQCYRSITAFSACFPSRQNTVNTTVLQVSDRQGRVGLRTSRDLRLSITVAIIAIREKK
jgi:hypothetical protein